MTATPSMEIVYVKPDGTVTYDGLALLQDLAAVAGGTASWGTITGTLSSQTDLNTALSGKAATVHTHTASQVTDLATTVQAYTLDTFANPVASMDFAQQQSLQFVIENRTSDPGSPVTGQIWLRTDI
jgi:hypothetical protein